jgi:multiple sugar transport system substrate-binding protein
MWQQWGSGHEKQVLDETISTFEKANPNIKITETCVTDNSKILTAISSGTPPDILALGCTNVMGEWASKGALTSLDNLIARDHIDKSKFVTEAFHSVTCNGKIYAMPFVPFNEGFLWNKDLFRKAGLDPNTPPRTLDELLVDAKKLTKTDSSGKIIQMGFLPKWPSSHLTTSLTWLFGGDYYNSTTQKITANDPGVIKAIDWERQVYNGISTQAVENFVNSSGQYLTAQDPFESGKLAMCIDGSWELAYIKANVPNLDPDIGCAYIPASSDHPELYGTTFIDVNPQIIPAGSKHVEEAWKFISWETTDVNVCSTFASLVAGIPQLKATPLSGLLSDPRFKVFIDMADSSKARVIPKMSVSSEYFAKILDIESKALIDPKLDYKKMLNDLNSEMNKS